MFKINGKIILTICTVSCALGLIFNWINPKGVPLIAEEKVLKWKSGSFSVPANTKEPYAVNLEQAKELYEQKEIFIDAREKEEYLSGHIKGAVNIPFDDMDNYRTELEKIKKDEIIVTYCSGSDCDLSILLGNKLFELGYKNVYIFFGGWIKWLSAKYPVEGNSIK